MIASMNPSPTNKDCMAPSPWGRQGEYQGKKPTGKNDGWGREKITFVGLPDRLVLSAEDPVHSADGQKPWQSTRSSSCGYIPEHRPDRSSRHRLRREAYSPKDLDLKSRLGTAQLRPEVGLTIGSA